MLLKMYIWSMYTFSYFMWFCNWIPDPCEVFETGGWDEWQGRSVRSWTWLEWVVSLCKKVVCPEQLRWWYNYTVLYCLKNGIWLEARVAGIIVLAGLSTPYSTRLFLLINVLSWTRCIILVFCGASHNRTTDKHTENEEATLGLFSFKPRLWILLVTWSVTVGFLQVIAQRETPLRFVYLWANNIQWALLTDLFRGTCEIQLSGKEMWMVGWFPNSFLTHHYVGSM